MNLNASCKHRLKEAEYICTCLTRVQVEFHEAIFGRKNGENFEIRKGVQSDCTEIRRLIQELADYQKMSDGPKIGAKDLEKDGFQTQPPLFNLLVAYIPGDDKLIGYALFYNKYSTWTGKAMILEDLYCTPEYRGKSVGSKLFRAVVKEALDTGCQQLDFEVLSWNPATNFYNYFGAQNITEKHSWHIYRMSRKDLENVNSYC